MSATRVLAVLCLCTATASAQWTLVWSDEFDGPNIDTSKWSFMIGTGTAYGLPAGWGNNELQYYRSENATIVNGALRIRARNQNFGGSNYTSARLRSLNKGDFLYGRIEARIQLPSDPGLWPAFWMMPSDSIYGTWAASGEIDIMESVNYADTIYGTLHFGGTWPNNTMTGGDLSDGTDFSQGYHVYGIEWDPDEIRWYLDGNLYSTKSKSQWFSDNAPGSSTAPFDQEFHLLLNLAVGGNFPGSPNGQTDFPADYFIDWVRVYQVTPVPQAPYLGVAFDLPGRIEGEDFDVGGQNVSYFDCDAANNGGAYRPNEWVDVQAGATGHNVGWMCSGEWLEYTVDVPREDLYRIEARVASQSTGGSFTLEFDGDPVPGFIPVPATGNWQIYTTVQTLESLTPGEKVMRFQNGTGGGEFNIDYFDIWYAADVDRSGSVDLTDVAIVLGDFGSTCSGPCPGDTDNDGDTDLSDLSRVLASFGAG